VLFGTVRALFLVDDDAERAADQRLELRALRELVRLGRLAPAEAAAVRDRLKRNPTASAPEIVLKDTTVDIATWASALVAAAKPTWLDRVRGLFGGGRARKRGRPR
jgi:hypothetical protein